MTDTYLLHGLRVRSEVPLDAAHVEAGEADIQVHVGDRRDVPREPPPGKVIAALEIPGASSSITFADDRYLLRVNGLCDFEIDAALATITVHLDPGTGEEGARLLIGGVLASLMSLRGLTVIHASAVEAEEGAVAFVGNSGMGKTTVAALCCAAGAKLVSDDALRVGADEAGAWCYRGTAELRLRQPAASLAQIIGSEAVRSTLDLRTATRPAPTAAPRLGLAAVVAPVCDHQSDVLEVTRLRGPEAAMELVRYPRSLGWRDPAPLRRDFDVLARVAKAVPVYRAVLPWGPPFQPDLGARLLAEIG